MRQPQVRSITSLCAAGVFLCSAVQAGEPGSAAVGLGLEAALGAGAVARVDPAAALFENPGRLALLRRPEAWSSAQASDGQDTGRLAFTAPLLAGPVLGLGVSRLGAAAFGAPRELVHLAGAQTLGAGAAAGAALTLQSQTEAGAVQTSFGLDLGLHWGLADRFAAGVVLANAVEPRLAGSASAREWRAAAAWTQPLASYWSAGLCAGVQAPESARRELAAAATLRRGRMEVAAGMHAGDWRYGASLALGAWRLGYSHAGEAVHEVAVQLRFGPSRDERRLRQQRQSELEMAGRVHDLVGSGERLRLVALTEAADSAFAAGRFTTATDLYAAAAALAPGESRAEDGLRRARNASWVREADSLQARRDDTGALFALQQALRHLPEDSTSARRLQELRQASANSRSTADAAARRFATGEQAFAQQRYLDAARAFEAVLRLRPDHPQAKQSLQRARNAHELWRRGILQNARQRLESGDFAGAAAQTQRVLDLEPRENEARKLLARIERHAQAASAAAPAAAGRSEDAAPVPPEVAGRYDEGMRLYRAGDLVGAMLAWEEVSRLAPHYQEVDGNLLRVYRVTGLESYTEGRLREAVDIWEKALKLDPSNVQLRRYLNQAHVKLTRTTVVEPQEP